MGQLQITKGEKKGVLYMGERFNKGLILQRAFYKSRISLPKELAVMPGKSKKPYRGR